MSDPTELEPELSDATLHGTSVPPTPEKSQSTKSVEGTLSKPWKWHHESFQQVLGDTPSIELLLELTYTFAHEAGVYFGSTDELFVTSNRLIDSDGTQRVQISKISLNATRGKGGQYAIQEEIDCDSIQMGNGGVNFEDGILFCAQGSRTSPSGLYKMSRKSPYGTSAVLTDYHGVPFNSVNDVVVSKVDGSIWFTDPPYGAEQGYKDSVRLPSQIYSYQPPRRKGDYGVIRAIVDGFGHPNGLCFSPDESLLYITDTDKQHGSGEVRQQCPSSIYVFDIIRRHDQSFVCNRRLFAFVEAGIPDGIKCDTTGRVYSGCGDGIHVWSPGGVPLGRILIPGGVANFCFGRAGEIYALNETRLWRVNLAANLEGALLAELQSSEERKEKKREEEKSRVAVVEKRPETGSGGFWRRLRKMFRIA